MAYEDNSVYNKYLDSSSESGCGCEGSSSEDCGCCPAGLVAVYNTDGEHAGCLTPADADEYNANNRSCKEGYVALWENGTPKFLGCVPSDEFAALYAAVNP